MYLRIGANVAVVRIKISSPGGFLLVLLFSCSLTVAHFMRRPHHTLFEPHRWARSYSSSWAGLAGRLQVGLPIKIRFGYRSLRTVAVDRDEASMKF